MLPDLMTVNQFVYYHELFISFGVVLSITIWTVATGGAGTACSSEVSEFMLVSHYFFCSLVWTIVFSPFSVILANVLAVFRFPVSNYPLNFLIRTKTKKKNPAN